MRFDMPPGWVFLWFCITGKKIREIQKIAPEKYAWME